MTCEDRKPAEFLRQRPSGSVAALDRAAHDWAGQVSDRAGPLPVFTLNLSLDVRPLATDWTTVLARDIEVPVLSAVTDIPAPPAMLIRIGKPAVTVRSYCFPELPSSGVPDPGTPRRPGATSN